MIGLIDDMRTEYQIIIVESEPFKQAYYNGNLSDTEEHMRDKIELAIKHYPGRHLQISTYESDKSSMKPFAFGVVIPAEI